MRGGFAGLGGGPARGLRVWLGAASRALVRLSMVAAVGFSVLLALVLAGPAAASPVTLSFTMAFGASSIPVGASTSLTYTLANTEGAPPLTALAFQDSLPAGLVVSTTPGASTTCSNATLEAAPGSGSVTLAGASLGVGATCTVVVDVTGTSEGVKQNSIPPLDITTAQGVTNTASASANLFVGVLPLITTSFAPTSIALGATTTLSVTVQNPNATTTLSGISLADALPAGLVVASPSGAQGTCGGGVLTAVPGSGMFSFAGGQLAPGASCTVSLTVKATQTGIKQNIAGPVSSTQTGVAGLASATLTVTPPVLSVSKNGSGSGTVTGSPSGIDCGATCSASFAAGSMVTLTATPDAGSTFAGWSGAGCSGTGTCTVTMSADESVTATFTARPSPTQTSPAPSPASGCQDPAGAYNQGFNSGFNSGFDVGFDAGFNPGFQSGFTDGSRANAKRASIRAASLTPKFATAGPAVQPDCDQQFNQGFNTAFSPGFNSGFQQDFNSEFASRFNPVFSHTFNHAFNTSYRAKHRHKHRRR